MSNAHDNKITKEAYQLDMLREHFSKYSQQITDSILKYGLYKYNNNAYKSNVLDYDVLNDRSELRLVEYLYFSECFLVPKNITLGEAYKRMLNYRNSVKTDAIQNERCLELQVHIRGNYYISDPKFALDSIIINLELLKTQVKLCLFGLHQILVVNYKNKIWASPFISANSGNVYQCSSGRTNYTFLVNDYFSEAISEDEWDNINKTCHLLENILDD